MSPIVLSGILSFLPWCWLVNMSLNALGFVEEKSRWIRKHNAPLDFGVRLWGARLFGDSTTWLGVWLAIMIGAIAEIAFPGNYFFVSALCVFFGDTAGSFIKRRLGIPRGVFLPFIDHGDYVLVAGSMLLFLGRISFTIFLTAYFITLMVTPFVTYLAHRAGVRARAL